MENAEQELDVLDVLMEKLVEKPPGVNCFSVEGFSVEAAIVEGLPLFDALVGQTSVSPATLGQTPAANPVDCCEPETPAVPPAANPTGLATVPPAAGALTPAAKPVAVDSLPESVTPAKLLESPSAAQANLSPQENTVPPTKRLKTTLRSTVSTVEETGHGYCVRFEGNNSKRWDGKQIMLEREWLESLYSQEDLCPGKVVELPWEQKGAGCVKWRAVIVDSAAKSRGECLLTTWGWGVGVGGGGGAGFHTGFFENHLAPPPTRKQCPFMVSSRNFILGAKLMARGG